MLLDASTLTGARGEPVVEFDGVRLTRRGRSLLRNISWRLSPGENWAVLGRNGAGKTLFMRLAAGELWPDPDSGRRVYRVGGEEGGPLILKPHVGSVSLSQHVDYLRQERDISALDVVLSGFSGGLRLYGEPTAAQLAAARVLLDGFGLLGMADRPLHAMSLGQGRKVLLSRALVRRPRLLLLDEALDGLDAASRAAFLETLEAYAADGGQFVMTAHRPEDFSRAVNRVLVLKAGRVDWQGCVEDAPVARLRAAPRAPTTSGPALASGSASTPGPGGRPGPSSTLGPASALELDSTPSHGKVSDESVPSQSFDPSASAASSQASAARSAQAGPASAPSPAERQASLSSDVPAGVPAPFASSAAPVSSGDLDSVSAFLVRLEDASVRIAGQPALSGVSWEVRSGELWQVGGPNGSGKSTLLRLIAGDLHPLPGGRVLRFGRFGRSALPDDAPPVTLWEIRRRVGLVSGEFQARYHYDISAEDVVASGFFGSIGVWQEIEPGQRAEARRLLDLLGLEDKAGQPYLSLSSGEQRRAVLARALVHDPELLLLDEPCAGLDPDSRQEFLDALGPLLAAGKAIVLVSHYDDDILPGARRLWLTAGRVVERT